jgi:hypothetical protein
MKYGPISAATSAMIKAIANPSSVVCTVSPFEHAPVRLARHGATHPPDSPEAAAPKSAPEQRHI